MEHNLKIFEKQVSEYIDWFKLDLTKEGLSRGVHEIW